VALGALPAAAQEIQQVRWLQDYAQAREDARVMGRPLLIDFGTEHCFWCRKLDATTFRDPSVAALLSREFVTLRIDAGRQPRLARALKVDRYPTLVLASPEGKVLDRQVGYLDAAQFCKRLQRVLACLPQQQDPEGDFRAACSAIAVPDYPRAIVLLRKVAQNGQGRPVQVKAQQLLEEFERVAGERLQRARELQASGQVAEAHAALGELVRTFDGTNAARDATQTLTARAR
jgi:thioredoxin-related protein